MAQPKKCNTDALYFSARLTEKLRGMLRAKTTLMEAPSGYGKTTAARAFFQRHLPEGAEFIRHVCLSEPPLVAWQRFCRTMQKIDAEAGSRLLQLGLPDEYTKGEAVSLLREMECAAPTWLVMDDFQHLKDLVSVDVWKAFAEHDAAHFHLVVLAQILSEPDIMPYVKHGLLYVNSEDLRLREQEIGEYFSAAGLPLAENEIREAYRRTEGWIVALYLHMLHYRTTGEFSPASGIRALLREIIWNRLNAVEKDFLLRVSPFDGYTARQAARLLNIPELLGQKFPGGRSRFGKSSFIRYDPASRRYYPHSTLLEFVREVFAEAPESLQREILYHAGDWCAEHREREKAIAFYYRLRDFEKILALDLTGMEEAGIGGYISGVGYAEVLLDIVEHCTTEMKTRWPMSMLHLAFELFGRGAYEEFGRLCAEMEGLIAQTGLTIEEKNRLQGELLLLKALSEYNNIAAMGELMRQASGLAGGKPSLINLANSWTFGNASVLLMYHAKEGCLDAELADMESYCQYYVAMTQGHGSGGDVLMQAEAFLCRGEMGAAEIFGHKAWYQAKLRGQSSICIASALLSGRLAIYNGKAGEFSSLLERMARQAEKNPQKSDRLEADMALAFLMELLGRPLDVAEWIQRGDIHEKRLFAMAIPYAHMLYAKYLLLTGKPEIWLGMADEALGLAGALRYPLALIYGHIHSAAAWDQRKERALALSALRQALDLALPDRLYLPFAENIAFIGGLFPLLKDRSPPFKDIFALAEKLRAGQEAVSRALYAQSIPFGMTRREYEAAKLAAQGFSNFEIAEAMTVSTNTVKTFMKSIYQKTGALSRPALNKLFRQK